ncbi:MAG: DUF4160 domain-containing protein [Betaproteobacteria bacterium]|nr:DUF4160 domain-containing protein [Betaproteobacteria bacterium]
MPTVLRVGGLRLIIWPDDHLPPHVHAYSADGSAKIVIGTATSQPHLMAVAGLSRRQTADALRAVADNQVLLLEAWESIHARLDR